jgi:hypothetical protein|tara:strand:- start:12832 stop:13383 length:552 start_codon:yes stop_codon:yes gene_type:complete
VTVLASGDHRQPDTGWRALVFQLLLLVVIFKKNLLTAILHQPGSQQSDALQCLGEFIEAKEMAALLGSSGINPKIGEESISKPWLEEVKQNTDQLRGQIGRQFIGKDQIQLLFIREDKEIFKELFKGVSTLIFALLRVVERAKVGIEDSTVMGGEEVNPLLAWGCQIENIPESIVVKPIMEQG